MRLQRSAGNQAVTELVRRAGNRATCQLLEGRTRSSVVQGFELAPPVPSAPVLQRYLAGPEGHGGGEEKALSEAGFSRGEAHLVYYGKGSRMNNPRGTALERVGLGRASVRGHG